MFRESHDTLVHVQEKENSYITVDYVLYQINLKELSLRVVNILKLSHTLIMKITPLKLKMLTLNWTFYLYN